MQIVKTIAEAQAASRAAAHPLGLVPTMGALHEGHLALVRQARHECATVAASVFVNPTQFGPNEDFTAYPRDTDRDLGLLEHEGVDLVFLPSVEEIYPSGFDTYVEVGTVTKPLEGEARPGHFRGVATVVAKLFHSVLPDRAYFGQKDAQQVLVIKKMVADLAFPLEVVVVPIVREPDGLALSSRNVYLSPTERQAALVLHRALDAARRLFATGERQPQQLRRAMRTTLAAEPLAQPDYVSLADPVTLRELDTPAETALASLAVRIGRTRLIDNALLGG
jgi:pantoate--beta-alanine ligase